MRNPKTKVSESEVQPLIQSTDKALPRIRRLPTKLFADSAGEPSNQPAKESGQPSNQPNDAVVQYCNKLNESHPRFGPAYTIEQKQLDAIKDKSWNHILMRSPDEQGETMEIYLTAIRRVERKAREMYAGKLSGLGIGSEFRWMMIKDGCFFLQLALLILGCSPHLGYSPNDPIFGRVQKRKEVNKWIEAMFFAGNQVPLVVLGELMKQKFFQDVIAKQNAKWDQYPTISSLCKRVLYQLLVMPALPLLIRRDNVNDPEQQQQQQLCDLLHGCQHLILGPAKEDHVTSKRGADIDEIDLEANEDEYERILPTILEEEETSPDDEIGHRMRNFLNAVGFSNAVDIRRRIFPSATELKRRGISMKKLKSGGARGIDFNSQYYIFWASLSLPTFLVDDNAELILQNLKNYENLQQGRQNGQEVSSYLRFMSDMVQTTKDAKLLHRAGIIQGKSDNVQKLPAMLNRLTSSGDLRLTQEMRILRNQINDYSSPWIQYQGVINLVVFLTLLQTLFALLAYFRPPN